MEIVAEDEGKDQPAGDFKPKLQKLIEVSKREYLHNESLEIGKSLTEMLLQKNGLERFLLALDDLGGEAFWKNSLMLCSVAKVLSKKPIKIHSREKYSAFILREILLLMKKERWASKFSLFFPILIDQFFSISAHSIQVNVVDKLLYPFHILKEKVLHETTDHLNFRLNESIWLLSRWLNGLPSSTGAFTCYYRLEKMLPLWIKLLGHALIIKMENSIFNDTDVNFDQFILDLQLIITRILLVASVDHMANYFYEILLERASDDSFQLQKVQRPLVICDDNQTTKYPHYGIKICISSKELGYEELNIKLAAFKQIIKKLSDAERSQLLIRMLYKLCERIYAKDQQVLKTDGMRFINQMERENTSDDRLLPHFVLCHVLEEFSEFEFNERISLDTLHICDIFLSNYIAKLENSLQSTLDIHLKTGVDTELAQLELQSLKLIVGLICAVVFQIQVDNQKALDLLKNLTIQMTKLVRLLREKTGKNDEELELLAGIEKILEFLCKDLLLELPTSKINKNDSQKLNSSEETTNKNVLDIILELENSDDELATATYGHHLISIAKLLRMRDAKTFSTANHFEQLYAKLTALLEANESYIFLAAINALAELAFWQTDIFLPRIVAMFRDWKPSGDVPSTSDDNKSVIVRAKIGEVLAKVARNLGDFSAHYFDEMANILFTMTKERDELVRASALSAFSDLIMACHGRYFERYLQELLYCIDHTLKFDKNLLVRRAAIHLLRSMITSASDHGLASLLETFSESLASITKRLKNLVNEDLDDVVRLHAEMALIEIGEAIHISLCK